MRWAIAGTILATWCSSPALAQSAAAAENPGAKLEFEVASIKTSEPPRMNGPIRFGPRGGPGSADPGRVTWTFSTIRDLMVIAYDVRRYQISGGPNWLDSGRFDITAKVPEGATKEQVRVMLQNLLAERFKLALHHETKELPIYALVVSAKGPRLKNSAITDEPPASDSQPGEEGREKAGVNTAARLPLHSLKIGSDGCPDMPPGPSGRPASFMIMTPSGECMISNGETMDGLARLLSDRFDRPVIDRTELKGKYDFRLHYDSSSVPARPGGPGMFGGAVMMKDGPGPGPAGGDPANRIAADVEPGPGIFEALQEQLGLKLSSKKAPVDLLVVDHVEKTPTEN